MSHESIVIDTVDKIVGIFPDLKKYRNFIINELLMYDKFETRINILEKVVINNVVYYKDNNRRLLDQCAKFTGTWHYSSGIQIYNIGLNLEARKKIWKEREDFLKKVKLQYNLE